MYREHCWELTSWFWSAKGQSLISSKNVALNCIFFIFFFDEKDVGIRNFFADEPRGWGGRILLSFSLTLLITHAGHANKTYSKSNAKPCCYTWLFVLFSLGFLCCVFFSLFTKNSRIENEIITSSIHRLIWCN